MKKQVIIIFVLVAFAFLTLTGCLMTTSDWKEWNSLPELEYDENGNVIYNGCIYEEMTGYGLPYEFTGSTKRVAKSGYWGLHTFAEGWGYEDFGEYIAISDGLWPFAGSSIYLKRGFEFPDYSTLTVNAIGVESPDHEYIKHEISDGIPFNELCTETDIEIYNLCREGFWVEVENGVYEYQAFWLYIYFEEYQNIYLTHLSLFVHENDIYFLISESNNYTYSFEGEIQNKETLYRINDEYRDLFMDVINELDNQ